MQRYIAQHADYPSKQKHSRVDLAKQLWTQPICHVGLQIFETKGSIHKINWNYIVIQIKLSNVAWKIVLYSTFFIHSYLSEKRLLADLRSKKNMFAFPFELQWLI